MTHAPGFRVLVVVSLLLPVVLAGTSFGQANVVGQWNTLPNLMPINPVHVALIHNGKVLVVSGSGNYPANLTSNFLKATVWDPTRPIRFKPKTSAGTCSAMAWSCFLTVAPSLMAVPCNMTHFMGN